MKLKLARKFKSAGAESFLFMPEEAFSFRPGQFLRYHLDSTSADERGQNRFFSISSAPFEKYVRITTKITPGGSSFKKDLQSLRTGDFIDGFGPSGSFTLEDPKKNYIFIAGGIGITPFRSILLDLDHRKLPLNITLLYAFRTKDIVFKDELNALAGKHPEFSIFYFISEDGSSEMQMTNNIKILPGKITKEFIKLNIQNFKLQTYYITGPEPMVLSFMGMLIDMGISKENIKTDEFPGYENY